MSSANEPRVVPAQLSFLAIYNPALGDSDETFHRQIVFYYAKAARARAQQDAAEESEEDGEKLRQTENEKLRRTENEELRQAENEKLRQAENEKLRQVGLAQGMVGFARSFASGESVDSIETEKSRIVLHELERGWWILASVDLTQLPAASTSKQSEQSEQPPAVEYSSREVSPPALLVQQLVRAHGVFTLHHGAPLAQLLSRYGRAKFCSILDTYWARFCAGWDVLLHASPAVDVFNGLKLAAGGELGVGVGEEDWGSSERDVLEHFARRTEGLVDVLVSRFGEASPAQHGNGEVDARPRHAAAAEPWLGAGVDAAATDGVVFSGVGGLSRASLRDVAHWTESIYHCGDRAYGIRDNPTADRRRRRRRGPLAVGRKPDPPAEEADPATGDAPRIPAPIVRAVESSLDRASEAVDQSEGGREPAAKQETGAMLASLGDTETWMKYMTLGYGTAWGNKKQTGPAKTPATEAQTPATKAKTPATEAEQSPNAMRYIEPAPDVDLAEEKRKAQVRAENDGYFLVGLKGDMVEADMDDDNDEGNWNARIQLRTVYVQAINKPSSTSASESGETPAAEGNVTSWTASLTRETSRLQPVVYIHRPFIYTFLFAHHTPSLTLASFYRSLHAFFAPLHRSLDRNTAPSRVAQRLLAARAAQTTTATTATAAATHGPNTWPIYDLVWDPRTLTLHSSLPNIPAPGALMADEGWSRLDALNVHAHILSTVATSRRSRSEIERTCKTSRGWWVVWMRLPPSQPSETRDFDSDSDPEHAGTRSVAFNTDELREAFLIRRARDGGESTQHKSGRSIASGMWSGMAMGMGASTHQTMGGKAAGWGPKGLAEGIGIDARRYVDELLSLNR
ncbi:uncharacterized protein M421DRAFT_100970 [Didymella exigua CBS 183.55]|uniref:CCZ1/INTU/HSP4 first Longin domain-containing protein n=1 Tax=Didymella exigua CBS 183.55 TaxID=1150837 RepID=A0A6A5RNH5_9PLEO|nr:uncharacterized protein M421DRAFT_100970 [Didymella exigua CBS 183.55]KAF1928688.1 hypothetical protein M421DRAFT_100970 [Didymella exigua CBS 183.55]